MRPAIIKHLHSSGGIIFTKAGEVIQVALISTKNHTVWTIPKGLIDKGEKPEYTAIREIMEETGLVGRVVDKLGEKSYWFYLKEKNMKCRKTVSYFLLAYVSGNIENYGREVDEARWFALDDALKIVSYSSDRDIIEKAKAKLFNSTGQI